MSCESGRNPLREGAGLARMALRSAMSHGVPTTEPTPAVSPPGVALQAYRWMLLARVFDDKMGALYRAGKVVGGVYLARGQEAFSAALGVHLRRELGDVYSPLIRDQAGRLAFGETLADAARTCLGSVEGPMRGRDGNIHRGRPREGMPAMISHLGSSLSVVNGYLIAKRHRGETGCVGAASAGDGATSTGAFHEGLNQAAVERLPLVVAVADNQFAYSTPTREQFACRSLAERAPGYGVGGYEVDGTDLEACLSVFAEAVAKARAGEGPQMVVGKLLRLAGHGEHDDASYVPEEVRRDRYGRDCLPAAKDWLLAAGRADSASLAELEREIREEVEEAVAQAQREDKPDPAREDWHVLATRTLREGEGR